MSKNLISVILCFLLAQQIVLGQDGSIPFITTWEVGSEKVIRLPIRENYSYDFDYAWIGTSDSVVIEKGFHTTMTGEDLVTYFDQPGRYLLTILGEYPHFLVGEPNQDKLLNVEQWGDVVWKSMERSFEYWDGSGFNAVDTPNLTKVTNMHATFRHAESFNEDLSRWDVENVTNLSFMFYNARSFNGDLSAWDVSNVTNMSFMFAEADDFNRDLGFWDVGNVTNMNGMFYSADAFNRDLGSWNIMNVKWMAGMLSLSGLTVSNYDRTLKGWERQNVRDSVSLGARKIHNCTSQSARTRLIHLRGWNITDEGSKCLEKLTVENMGN